MSGCWIRAYSEWETKGFAEQDVEMLKTQGKKARLNSTTRPVKTPFGTITGKRWFAEEYKPNWIKVKDKGAWGGFRYEIIKGGEEE
tara:strand:- start:848 stop:1105 length:258 start_codon:yes stop_codon:yes gene_type:complete